jgi:O-antigen ligase
VNKPFHLRGRFENTEYLKVAGVILVAISLPLSESIKAAGIIIAGTMLLVQVIKKENSININIMSYGFILFLIAALISTAFASQPEKSTKGAIDIFKYAIVFFVAQSIHKKDDIRKILWAIYLSTALAGLLGIYHASNINKQLEIHTLGNWNYTGMFLNIITASMLSTLLFSDIETKITKLTLCILAAITIVASIMTLSRASMVGFMVFVVLLCLSIRRLEKVLLLFIGVVIVTAFFYKTMWVKLFTTQSMISRFDIWRHAARLLMENPFFGIGLNNFSYTFPLNHVVEPGNTVYDAHSLYFQVASQMGFIGLLALSLIIVGFVKAWINFKPLTGFGKSLKFSAAGAFLIITATGLLDTTLHHEHAIAFTMMTGLMLGYSKGINNIRYHEKT